MRNVAWRLGFVESVKVYVPTHRSRLYERGAVGVPIGRVIDSLLDGPGRFVRDLIAGIISYERN